MEVQHQISRLWYAAMFFLLFYRGKQLFVFIRRRCYSLGNVVSLKSYGYAFNNSLARTRNAIDNVRVNSAFSC